MILILIIIKSFESVILNNDLLRQLGYNENSIDLELNNQNITDIASNVFDKDFQVEIINLSYNKLTANLKTLDLSFNEIANIEDKAFVTLNSLITLDLSFNLLNSIDTLTLNGSLLII